MTATRHEGKTRALTVRATTLLQMNILFLVADATQQYTLSKPTAVVLAMIAFAFVLAIAKLTARLSSKNDEIKLLQSQLYNFTNLEEESNKSDELPFSTKGLYTSDDGKWQLRQEKPSSSDCVTLHLSSALFTEAENVAEGSFIVKAGDRTYYDSGNTFSKTGSQRMKQLKEWAFSIPGVTIVRADFTSAYDIKLYKTATADWNKILPAIHKAVFELMEKVCQQEEMA